jgi:adenylate cyclase
MPSSLIEQLITQAELEAEQVIGLLRAGAALVLLAWMMISFRLDVPVEAALVVEPVRLVTVALGGFLLVGLASFVLARIRLFRPWMAFVLTAVDAAVLSLGLYAVLDAAALSGNWLPALPGLWLVPLLLSLGAVRYRPWVQVWATVLLVMGLSVVVVALGFDPHGPETGAGQQVDHLFSIAPTLVRGVLLTLMGLIAAVVTWRARALLLRAVSEASRRADLARFLPTEIAPLVNSDQLGAWRQGRRQQVTILFVDMRNSTEIAEDMDPMRLSVFMASFRRRILQAAKDNSGVVDKFIGDGALIVFGVPEPRPDDAARALMCARSLLQRVDRWNLKRNFGPPVRIGIGVHTGQVYCGLVGDDTRLEFTVLGDAVNVAARIEDATKQFGVPFLASEAVIAAAGELGRWQVVSSEPLRGRTDALRILVPRTD